MNWLNNPWVVGIGGGLLSGLLVTVVSRYLLGKRENREYLQRVQGANREVIYAMRPSISDGRIPSQEVVAALLGSTSRKYAVALQDLYNPAQIGEELVKEVMDSSFISAPQKAEFCTQLTALLPAAHLAATSPGLTTERVGSDTTPETIARYRERFTTLTSMLIGIMAATMTMSFVLVDFLKTRERALPANLEIFLPVLLSVLVLTVTMSVYVMYRDTLRRRRAPPDDRGTSARKAERADDKTS